MLEIILGIVGIVSIILLAMKTEKNHQEYLDIGWKEYQNKMREIHGNKIKFNKF